ncbi:MAG: hypothetical protein KF760_18380 [Candidatus Eremiobacteraeota bacterium]|nr:hypothetical protein [Candidatus Eremiobacteraeota bacterium]MCW5869368.1 hypothetical protein [Candidatus Eremiobacteraeota bacterium]
MDSFLTTSLQMRPASLDSVRVAPLVVPKKESGPVDQFRSEGKLLGREQVSQPLAPERDWVLGGPAVPAEKKSDPWLDQGGEWLVSGAPRSKQKEAAPKDEDLALEQGLIASLNLPRPQVAIEPAALISSGPSPEIRKLDKMYGGGVLLAASQTPEAAAEFWRQQNQMLATTEGREEYVKFLESRDAESGKLYAAIQQHAPPDLQVEHLKLVADDPKLAAAQLSTVDSSFLKKAAENVALATAFASVQGMAGAVALAGLTAMASATEEGAADLTAARAKAAGTAEGRQSLETVYGVMAGSPSLAGAQTKLDQQALASERGREATVQLQTNACQSAGLATNMVRVQAVSGVAPAVEGHATLAVSGLKLQASAATTAAGRAGLAAVWETLASRPEKAAAWVGNQALAVQSEEGRAAFSQLHRNLDAPAASAYTSVLAVAGPGTDRLFGGVAKDSVASGRLLGTMNQAPAALVRVVDSAGPGLAGVLASASQERSGVREVGRFFTTMSADEGSATSALRVVNSGGPEVSGRLLIGVARDREAAASVSSTLASASGGAAGRQQAGQLFKSASTRPETSVAAVRVVNAGAPEVVRQLAVGLAQDPVAASAFGTNLAVASRVDAPEVGRFFKATSEEPKAAAAGVALVNAAGPERVRELALHLAAEPEARRAFGENLVAAARVDAPEVGRFFKATSEEPRSATAGLEFVNALEPEKKRELVLNLAEDPVASRSFGNAQVAASKTEQGIKQNALLYESLAPDPKAAAAAASLIPPESAGQFLARMNEQPEARVATGALLDAAARTPQGQAVVERLLEDPQAGKLAQAMLREARIAIAERTEPVGVPARPADEKTALPEGATQPVTVPGPGVAEKAVAPIFQKAAQSEAASAQTVTALTQQAPARREQVLAAVAKDEQASGHFVETLQQAPTRVLSELTAKVAENPAASGSFLKAVSQAPVAPLLRKLALDEQASKSFGRILEKAPPQTLTKFLNKAAKEPEAFSKVIMQSPPELVQKPAVAKQLALSLPQVSQDTLVKTLESPAAETVIKAAARAPVATVAGLTERVAQGKLASAAFVRVVARAPLETVRGMISSVADSGGCASFVKALSQAPPAAVQVLLSRVASDQTASQSLLRALTLAATTPDGRAAVLQMRNSLGGVLAQAGPEAAARLKQALGEEPARAEKIPTVSPDKAVAAGVLKAPATTATTAVASTKKAEAVEGGGGVDMGNALHNRQVGRYRQGQRIPGEHRVNVLVGGKHQVKHTEESEEAESVQEVKKGERQRATEKAGAVEEIQPIQLFERGEKRGHSCSRCGLQFEGRVASCPNCQSEMRELLAVNSVSYRRAGFTISTSTDLVEVTYAARTLLDTEKSSLAGLRSPQKFVQMRDLLAQCQAPVTGYATVTRTRTRRPKFD